MEDGGWRVGDSTAQHSWSIQTLLFFFSFPWFWVRTKQFLKLFCSQVRSHNDHFSFSLSLICFVDKEVSEWHLDTAKWNDFLSMWSIQISTRQHFINAPHLQSVLHTSRVISFSKLSTDLVQYVGIFVTNVQLASYLSFSPHPLHMTLQSQFVSS